MTYEEDVVELWKTIEERLSSSDVKTCKSLLEDLKSHRSKASQVHTSLRRLFKKDEDLYQRDIEEGGIREEEDHHLRDDQKAHVDIKKKKKIDQAVAMANHETRVKVKEKDVTIVSPSYGLLTIPEEEEEEESVLNNKYIQIEVGTSGSKKQTRQQKAVAKCEDEMYEAERLITARILDRLKKKLDDLKDDRKRKTPGWKKVLEKNSAIALENMADVCGRILLK